MTLTREFKVGLFICFSSIIILLCLFYLASVKGFFEKIHTITLSSKSGDGFTEGMPVVFSGFNIGKVYALELNDKGVVLIKVKIPDRHFKWIHEDSSFILYRPLIGSSRIVVNTENIKSPLLNPNVIPEVTTINDINDAIVRIQPVLQKVTEIANNVERLTRTLSDPKGDFNLTLLNAQRITSKLSSKNSLLEMAVSNEESLNAFHDSLNNIRNITHNIDRLLIKFDKMADKTDLQVYGAEGVLPQINIILKDMLIKLQKLDKTLENINKISSDASAGMKDFRILRSDIDDAVHSIDDVAKKLDSLIGSKKIPEIKTP